MEHKNRIMALYEADNASFAREAYSLLGKFSNCPIYNEIYDYLESSDFTIISSDEDSIVSKYIDEDSEYAVIVTLCYAYKARPQHPWVRVKGHGEVYMEVTIMPYTDSDEEMEYQSIVSAGVFTHATYNDITKCYLKTVKELREYIQRV